MMMWCQIVVLLLVVDYFAEVEAKGKHWDNKRQTKKTKESRRFACFLCLTRLLVSYYCAVKCFYFLSDLLF